MVFVAAFPGPMLPHYTRPLWLGHLQCSQLWNADSSADWTNYLTCTLPPPSSALSIPHSWACVSVL